MSIKEDIADAKEHELAQPDTQDTPGTLSTDRPISAFAGDVTATTSNELFSTLLSIIRNITSDEIHGISRYWS